MKTSRRMTVYTLAYRLQGQIVWLNKKGKHIRPDKVSICKICGVSTADVDLCTVSNNGASGVASQLEAINNSGSTRLEIDSADKASGERAQSTDSESSAARRNVVVSPIDMVGNEYYMNQETSVELDGPVEDSYNEGYC